MVKLIKFEQAINESESFKKRHLLLGNGFSIACCPKIFTYGSLFEQADFSNAPKLSEVFKVLGTNDFEKVIRILDDASKALPIYAGDIPAVNNMADDARDLKSILIHTIAKNHPSTPIEINDAQFLACRKFLAHFIEATKEKGKVYTLNYDLLLYWAVMHDNIDSDKSVKLAKDDGFGRDEDTDPDFVNWMGESKADYQRIHYLHGALHLFDAGSELHKYTWINTGLPLLEQAQAAMALDKFPLFVAEGNSEDKLSKIKHSAYLHHSYKSFSRQMEQKNNALFIFGHSLADNDDHILKCITRGQISRVYVSLHGDPNSDENKVIISSARRLGASRDSLQVEFFDAESAQVWNYQP